MASGFAVTDKLVETEQRVVYRAVRRADDLPVTLFVARTAVDLPRLENELGVTTQLDSAVVPRPLGLTQHEGKPALVTEALEGVSLRQLLTAPLETGSFLTLAAAIAGAVAEVHRHGLIHRDLRPEHIIVEETSGAVKITGFGLACPLPQQRVRAPTNLEGTLAYMSPEQTGRMNRPIDHRSDLYALGVIFFEMLVHRLPFQARDPLEWVHCHAARRPPAPVELLPGLPGTVSDLVLKLLAKRGEDRYQSAAGLRHDLEVCLEQWRRAGRIERFVLAERDVPDRFSIKPGLYGRDAEISALLGALERVIRTATPALVMVAGPAGIGKTALVNELQARTLRERGRFVAGKCDQHKRNLPYAAIGEAFHVLASELLAEPEERLATWRQSLQAALAEKGQIIIDLIPSVQLIVGEQPEVAALPFAETQNRLQTVFGDFVHVLAQPGPLVVFLDDLHWSDTSSLTLIQHLLQPTTGRPLLLVGAYRQAEVGADHPLSLMLKEVERSGANVEQISLPPLSVPDLTRMVADAARCSPEEAAPLAVLLQRKTGGNPFFAIEFLRLLDQDDLLRFDGEALRWRWNLDEIMGKEHAANVVDLLIGKAMRLPARARQALELASCLGSTLDLPTLGTVVGRSEEETRADLWPSLQEGLLLPTDGVYRFAHDRVRQAAYALLPEEQRAAVHLDIGRRLLEPAATLDERIFGVLNHLNLGSTLIVDPEERHRVAGLNLQAGRKARASAAWGPAYSHFRAGLDLCGEETWRSDYELALALHQGTAETAYLSGDFQTAAQLVDLTLRHARTALDMVRSYQTRIDYFIAQKRLREATRSGLEILELLGLTLPERPGKLQTMARLVRIMVEVRRGGIERLAELPEMENPVALAQMRILESIGSAVYLGAPQLVPLIALTGIELSLKHGNSAGAPYFYAGFGLVLCAGVGDFDAGYRFGKLALDLLERRNAPELRTRVHFVFNDFIRHTREPLRASLEPLLQGYRGGLQSGDFEYAARSLWVHTLHLFFSGEGLIEVERAVEAAVKENERLKQGTVVSYAHLLRQLVANLRGESREPCLLTGQHLDEAKMMQIFTETNDRYGVATLRYFKLLACYLFNDYRGAIEQADRLELNAITSLCNMYQFYFYDSLARLGSYPEASLAERVRILGRVARNQRRLKKWARFVPATHLHRHWLVAAERARVLGFASRAMDFYDRAIEAAGRSDYLYEEAMTRERAGEFYLATGRSDLALHYLQGARDGYSAWGALAKVQALEDCHPALRSAPETAGRPPGDAPATDLSALDLSTVIKASQVISQEIALDKLIGTLMHFAIENAGAQRGCLLLARRAGLSVEAEAIVEGERVRVGSPATDELASLLPTSIINYVKRSGRSVILDDASRHNPYSSDPYLVSHKPISVLGIPLLKQGRLIGILYLENSLVQGAFQPDRVATLQLIATQAAISLESALAFEREQAARSHAETAERRSAFLAEASRLLGESLDYQATIQRVVRLALPFLADWCIVDIIEDGQKIERVAAAHLDPKLEPLLREIQRRYPPDWDSPHPAAAVLRDGEPVHLVRPDPETIRAHCLDEEHYQLLLRVGAGEALAVPLAARGRVLGALTLVASPQRPSYGPADVELARELGHRIATAIDNAALYSRAETAVRVRDEFLSIASHELNTPMTSLLLTLQGLEESDQTALEPEVMRHLVTIARRQGDRLSRLTQALLDVTRVERGLSLELDDVDLVSLVRDVVGHFARELEQAGCTASIEGSGPVRGRWDRARIEQVVSNLLSNAAKFGAGKPIEITIGEADGLARLTVRDHGIGINPTQQQQIFQRYGRAVSTSHYGGLGLGLYICRLIANAHGGSIRAEGATGPGATFIVEIPCAGPISGVSSEEERNGGSQP